MIGETSPLIETPRLRVHSVALDDAGFVARLLNEPEFIRFIGDKGVRCEEDARLYLANGALADYQAHGYGAYLVRLRDGGDPVGICGFYQRSNLDCPDLGFAFLRSVWGHGYAVESSLALLDYGRDELGVTEVAAIVDAGNSRSIRVVETLGFAFDGHFQLPDDEHSLRLYRRRLTPTV